MHGDLPLAVSLTKQMGADGHRAPNCSVLKQIVVGCAEQVQAAPLPPSCPDSLPSRYKYKRAPGGWRAHQTRASPLAPAREIIMRWRGLVRVLTSRFIPA